MHNGKHPPKHVVVFRDGGSDGSFDRIRETELRTIRRVFSDLNSKDFKCKANCNGEVPDCRGCSPPKITFVAAQRDHNMCVVPANPTDGINGNVPSGTLVKNSIACSGAVDDQFDFLLTPQGGLKGTSKPMYYRVLTNENKLSRDDLHNLVYCMAFQCKSKVPFKVSKVVH